MSVSDSFLHLFSGEEDRQGRLWVCSYSCLEHDAARRAVQTARWATHRTDSAAEIQHGDH